MNTVTGGTGLLGAHLLFHLLQKVEKVRALKRKDSSLKLVKRVFSWYTNDPESLLSKIEWVDGDILDIFSLEKLFDGAQNVFHTAARVSFDKNDRELLLKTNIEGTANVVNVLLEMKDVKLCHVSSIGAFGRVSDRKKLITEKTHFSTSENPSVYSISKYESEREVWRGIVEGLDAVIVNPSIILGPGNWNKGSSKLFTTVYKSLNFYTGGENGFVDVNDLAKIMIRLMESDISGEQFIVSAENVTYWQFFQWMAEALKVKPPEKKAGKLLSSLTWRALKVKELVTGEKSSITRETAQTAQQVYRYDNSKLLKTIDFKYTPIKQTIQKTATIFLREHA
jgi:nucleoside-diphosphate-sugar epimerase